MRLEQLEYVIAVSDYGSMNTAAQYLHVSQQNISKSIKQLENELDITIFIRSKKGAHLTPQGAKLYQFACKHIEEYARVKEDLTAIQKRSLQGTLNICTTNSGTSMIVPQLLCEFYKSYPNVMVNVQDGTADFVIRQVEQGFCDIGIITYNSVEGTFLPKIPEDIKVFPLIKGNWYFWVSENSSYAKRGYITYEEANQESVLVDNALDTDALAAVFAVFGLTLNIGMRAQNLYLIGKLIAEGKGVFPDAKFPNEELLYSYAFQGLSNLKAIPVRAKNGYSAIGYLVNKERKQSELLSNTIKFLNNHFLENGGGGLTCGWT